MQETASLVTISRESELYPAIGGEATPSRHRTVERFAFGFLSFLGIRM